jgi:hypothetical protein
MTTDVIVSDCPAGLRTVEEYAQDLAATVQVR